MYYFIEMSLLPDDSVSRGFVMGKVMNVLHLCFVNLQKELGHNPVGLAFPEYCYDPEAKGTAKASLGTKIRLYAQTEAHLEALNLKQQFSRFEDYVHLRAIREDAAKFGFVCFKRKQVKSSIVRVARRKAQHLQQTLPETLTLLTAKGQKAVSLDLPFVHLHSQSSDQAFRLFIEKQTAQAPTEWKFSSYGLSNSVGVPNS